jgi:hypothetical protein
LLNHLNGDGFDYCSYRLFYLPRGCSKSRCDETSGRGSVGTYLGFLVPGVVITPIGAFLRSVDKLRLFGRRDLAGLRQCAGAGSNRNGAIMAKRKKGSKVKSRAKLRRASSAKRGKAHKAKAAKRTVAKAKPKSAPAKKAAPKAPVVAAVETVAVEVIEQPAPGVTG